MGYSKYKKLKVVTQKFGLKSVALSLFDHATVAPRKPSEWLTTSLRKAYATPPSNEKSKSERLVSPTLLEVLELFEQEIRSEERRVGKEC